MAITAPTPIIGPERIAAGREFATALRDLDHAQKPGAGVPAYTRWINRRLARYAAAAAYSVGLSANAMTAISAWFSLSAILTMLIARPEPLIGLIVAVLFAVGYILDSADGQVARLGKAGSPAGEWLDHVVDAIRTPAIHLAVFVSAAMLGAPTWLLAVALLYTLVSVGQFMSQILGEQLRKASGAALATPPDSRLRSFVLLPSDMGVLCWIFVFWGVPAAFYPVYALLFALNAAHSAVSMMRRFRELSALR